MLFEPLSRRNEVSVTSSYDFSLCTYHCTIFYVLHGVSRDIRNRKFYMWMYITDGE
jgi:hypothetical protein